MLQVGAGVCCVLWYFMGWSMLLSGAFLGCAFLFYLARVYLKGVNVEHFYKYKNVDQDVAPGMSGRERRKLRRKNDRDKELKDIERGIL